MSGIERLHDIMTRLRDPEKGCPWDREQTLESLKPCLLEETHELLAAMDRPEDKANYVEELGDVLLQVMFQCVMAEQEGRFSFDDVANAISDKLVHRHPHVFGNVDAKDSATVLRNWEQIKQMEHKKESRHSALDGVPAALPALLKAQRTQEKAARVGFDWKDAEGPLEKIKEEIRELEAEIAARNGSTVAVESDPATAVRGANALYTDVWVSMGEEAKTAERLRLLRPYQVNMDLCRATGNLGGELVFLHCLPAFHDAETEVSKDTGAQEVTDEVFEAPFSRVFDEAENRMHTIKALFVSAIGTPERD